MRKITTYETVEFAIADDVSAERLDPPERIVVSAFDSGLFDVAVADLTDR